jgi:hypothetical protein
MTVISKAVRVFISSTSRDMHAEQDHLVTVIFPEFVDPPERLAQLDALKAEIRERTTLTSPSGSFV